DGRRRQHQTDILEADSKGGELDRIDLHPNGRLLLAENENLRDARELGNLLRQDGVGVVVRLDDRMIVRVDRNDEDRRIRRIDLSKDRRGWQGFLSISPRPTCRALGGLSG